MKRSRVSLIILMLLCMMLALSGCAKQEEAPTAQSNYQQAIALLQEGQYEKAASAFEALGHYYDASAYAMYSRALQSAQDEDYAQASATLLLLEDFMNSHVLAVYYEGRALESTENYEKALPLYEAVRHYADAGKRAGDIPGLILKRDYNKALALEKAGAYQQAIEAYEALDGYADSKARIAAIHELLNSNAYARAEKMLEQGDYEAAYNAFQALGNYKDSAQRTLHCIYLAAKQAEKEMDLTTALQFYQKLDDYLDSSSTPDCIAAPAFKTRMRTSKPAWIPDNSRKAPKYRNISDRGNLLILMSATAGLW